MGADGSGDGVVNAADYVVWRKFSAEAQGQGTAMAPRAKAAEAPSTNLAITTGSRSHSMADTSDSIASQRHEEGIPSSVSWFVPRQSEESAWRKPRPAAAGDRSNSTNLSNLTIANLDSARIDSTCDELAIDQLESRPDEYASERSLPLAARDQFDAEIWSDDSWLASSLWRPRGNHRAT
jgi:hypothetical protein